MIRRQSPYFSLATLRRSVRLAAFALAVFVLRLGMVAACEPSDLAELLSGQADGHAVVSTLDASSDSVPDSPEPSLSGHCLHCGCHFPAALPTPPEPMAVTEPGVMAPRWNHRHSDVPPARELRPPIA
jgi:hypothetical protein